jgi:hypothetical protein
LHKARELLREEFQREVSKHLTGKGTEPWEILYFKVHKSQLPVIEQLLDECKEGGSLGPEIVGRELHFCV